MICGVDEAGRGPVIGPLVIAGVTFTDDPGLAELGVKDSKRLSPMRRRELAAMIRSLAEKVEVVVISAADIDDLRKVMTLNELEVSGFARAIERLPCDQCFVDAADVNEQRFGREIAGKLKSPPRIVSKHKGDDIFPVVGAASIIAKTTRDDIVKNIEKKLSKKLDLPLGSGYPADPVTKHFLEEWVRRFGSLPPHVRTSWKTAEKIMAKSRIRRLDDF